MTKQYHWKRFLRPYLRKALPNDARTEFLLSADTEHDMWWERYRTLISYGNNGIPLRAAVKAFRNKVPAKEFLLLRRTQRRR